MLIADTDPNWFYSTLAQSTAALVGLAGAFLFQRVLSQRSEIGPLRNTIQQGCKALHQQMYNEAQSARAALETVQKALDDARAQAVGLLHVSRTVNALDVEGGASGEVGLPRLDADIGIKILEEASRRLLDFCSAVEAVDWQTLVEDIRVKGELSVPSSDWLIDPGQRPVLQSAPPGSGLWARLEEQRFIASHRWCEFLASSREYGRDVDDLRARLVPQSLYFLFAILALLTIFGVAAPLFFLTGESGASKPVFLTFIIPLSLGFVGFFGYELYRLRRADRMVSDAF